MWFCRAVPVKVNPKPSCALKPGLTRRYVSLNCANLFFFLSDGVARFSTPPPQNNIIWNHLLHQRSTKCNFCLLSSIHILPVIVYAVDGTQKWKLTGLFIMTRRKEGFPASESQTGPKINPYTGKTVSLWLTQAQNWIPVQRTNRWGDGTEQ